MQMIVFFLFFAGCALAQAKLYSEACPDFDASKIKMVTFDCFAALMAWEDSMAQSVSQILPNLNASDVRNLVLQWETAYAQKANTIFDEVIFGEYPFSVLVSSQLGEIANSMGLKLSRNQFTQLVQSWGKLTPWLGTQETLEVLVAANISLGSISNADRITLASDLSIFREPVVFKNLFPSDFPVGAFKPQPSMYLQALGLGFKADEIIHIAGGSTDASGARDAGLFSAYLQGHKSPFSTTGTAATRSGNKGLFGEPVEVGGTAPCFIMNDITELPGYLGL